jgi:hypothetical protein
VILRPQNPVLRKLPSALARRLCFESCRRVAGVATIVDEVSVTDGHSANGRPANLNIEPSAHESL